MESPPAEALSIGSAKSRFRDILRQTSVQSREQPVFRLASGKMSRHYIDCKQALSDPEARALVGRLILDRIADCSFEAVGVPNGATRVTGGFLTHL